VRRRSLDEGAEWQHKMDREKVAAMMLRLGIATGHGDTIDDLLGELEAGIKRLQQTRDSRT